MHITTNQEQTARSECLYKGAHFLYFILGSGELLEKVGKSGVSAVTTTPEYNLLRENYEKIVNILCQSSDLSALAERLHSAQLIDKSVMEEASRAGEARAVRFSRLMSAVLAQVKNNRHNFDQFVSVMEDWPEAKMFLEQLQGVCMGRGKCEYVLIYVSVILIHVLDVHMHVLISHTMPKFTVCCV